MRQVITCAVAHYNAKGEPVFCPGYPHTVVRADDPDHLMDTEVDPPLGWGEDYDAFVRSLA